MNPKVLTALLVSLVLLLAVEAGLRIVKADSNTPLVFSGGITIYSPVNTTYYTNFLNLNLTSNCGAGVKIYFSYDLDGKYQNPITLTFNVTPGFHMFAVGSALVQLPILSSGSHRLTVFQNAYLNNYHGANPPGPPFKPTAPGSDDYVASWTNTVYFTISSNGDSELVPPKDSSPPTITFLSIENKTYNQDNLPLIFTINEPTTWIGYCLDRQVNVTITKNFTLTDLSLGSHTLSVYANDTVGNMAITSVDFNIAACYPWMSIVLVSATVAIVVALVALVNLKKRKRVTNRD